MDSAVDQICHASNNRNIFIECKLSNIRFFGQLSLLFLYIVLQLNSGNCLRLTVYTFIWDLCELKPCEALYSDFKVRIIMRSLRQVQVHHVPSRSEVEVELILSD